MLDDAGDDLILDGDTIDAIKDLPVFESIEGKLKHETYTKLMWSCFSAAVGSRDESQI